MKRGISEFSLSSERIDAKIAAPVDRMTGSIIRLAAANHVPSTMTLNANKTKML